MILVSYSSIIIVLVFDLLLPNKYKVRRLHIWGFNPDIKRLEQLVSKLE